MSFTTLDRLLGLPAGTARRRHLAVLVVHAAELAGTPFRRGDRLILEPGSATPLSRLVACRIGRKVAVYATGLTRNGEIVLLPTNPEALPLPFTGSSSVIGVVLAAVRRSNEGPLLARAPSYDFGAGAKTSARARRGGIAAELRSRNATNVDAALSLLERFAAQWEPHRDREARALLAAIFRVRTLGRCMAAVTDGRLYDALVREINIALKRLKRSLLASREADAEELESCLLRPITGDRGRT